MKFKTIQVQSHLTDEETESLAGELLTEKDFDILISDEPTKVYHEDRLLAVFIPKCLDSKKCYNAWKVLRELDYETLNRGTATGKGLMAQKVLSDGSLSNTRGVPKKYAPKSGIIGYFDRYPRTPYCRKTAFNLNKPEKFAQALPFIQEVNEIFKKYVPDRYEAQLKMVKKTEQDWVIHGTAFTTITVNQNWQTAVHTDVGDLREGFGVATALKAGKYSGGYTIYPKYRVGFNLKSGDVLLWNVHEWHGNAPLKGKPGKYERVSCIFSL